MISTEAEQGVAFDKMIELQQRAADIVSQKPSRRGFHVPHRRRQQRELRQMPGGFS